MDDFYVLEYLNFVNIIAITEEGKFIIEEQYRHGLQLVALELCASVCEKVKLLSKLLNENCWKEQVILEGNGANLRSLRLILIL